LEARASEGVSQAEETAVIWIPIRRRGKLLFEYDPLRLRVRVKVRGQEELVVVELAGVDVN
jgi:hypothetical protein